MSGRFLVVASAAAAIVVLSAPTGAGQDRPVAVSGAAIGIGGLLDGAEGHPLPRTPWGAPDLQGVWNNSTRTPLERQTEAELERGRLARQAVTAATRGTGAAWLEQGGNIDQPSLVIDPPDGQIPELRPAAKQRLIDRENARAGRGEADSWLDRSSLERCITRTMPVTMFPHIYNANYQILQTPDYVAILLEMIHEFRIIPLDGRSHVPEAVRQWLGDSRGRWEGDTLVVETGRFNDRLDGGDHQPSHLVRKGHRGPGGTMRVVERFRLASANRIDYQFTVEDPSTFTRPYTVALPWSRRDTLTDPLNHLFEYACHEGNYAMANILRAGRANEQQAIEASAMVSRQRIAGGHPGVRIPAAPFVVPE